MSQDVDVKVQVCFVPEFKRQRLKAWLFPMGFHIRSSSILYSFDEKIFAMEYICKDASLEVHSVTNIIVLEIINDWGNN